MGSKSSQLEVIRAKFVDWCKYPDTASRVAAGLPATRRAFAEQYGVNRATLYRWETSKEFKDELTADVMNLYTADDVKDVLIVLLENAKKGKQPAINKVLELCGVNRLVNPEEIVDDNEFEGKSVEELEDFLEGARVEEEELPA